MIGMDEATKVKVFNEVEDVLEALFDGSMPVIVVGIKDDKTFMYSNISKNENRLELFEHFVAKEKSLKQEEAN